MTTKLFLDATSPLTDRRLRITSDDDPDAGENYGAGSGISLEDDPENEELEELEGNEGNEGNDADADDSGGGAEATDWKKRYEDTNESRKELKKTLDATIERLDRLESGRADTGDDIEELTRKYSDDLLSAVKSISEDDPDRINKVYGAIARKLAEAERNAVNRLRSEGQERTEAERRMARQREEASELAGIALEEVGLDKKALPLFQAEVNAIMKSNSAWFKAVPPSEQFISIARKVQAKVAANKQKKEEHRKGAGGVLGPGSRVNKKRSDAEDDSLPDTLTGALQEHKSNQYKDGLYRSKIVGRDGRG